MHNEYYAKIIEQNTFKCCIYLILNSFINILYPFCWEEGVVPPIKFGGLCLQSNLGGCASNQISKRGVDKTSTFRQGLPGKGG